MTRIVGPLINALLRCQVPVPSGNVNPITWTEQLVRIMHLDTISTTNHPSPVVETGKTNVIRTGAVQLLRAAISRREGILSQMQGSDLDGRRVEDEIQEFKRLGEELEYVKDPASCTWDMAMTTIVARKSFRIDEKEIWMTPKY